MLKAQFPVKQAAEVVQYAPTIQQEATGAGPSHWQGGERAPLIRPNSANLGDRRGRQGPGGGMTFPAHTWAISAHFAGLGSLFVRNDLNGAAHKGYQEPQPISSTKVQPGHCRAPSTLTRPPSD